MVGGGVGILWCGGSPRNGYGCPLFLVKMPGCIIHPCNGIGRFFNCVFVMYGHTL